MVDPLSDMFTRIRNAQAVGKETVIIPYSNFKMAIASKLQELGYIKSAIRRGRKNRRTLELVVLYGEDGSPRITNIDRISKPSRRVYLGSKFIHSVRQGSGVMFVSTPKGILTDKEARKEKVGGEALCKIW